MKHIFTILVTIFSFNLVADVKYPYFMTIKAKEAYQRSGPGTDFPVNFIYKKRYMPVKVLAKYERWYQVSDLDGNVGWMNGVLLSRSRSLYIAKDSKLYKDMAEDAKIIANLEAGNTALITHCPNKNWCHIKIADFKGYIKRENSWGLFNDEIIVEK